MSNRQQRRHRKAFLDPDTGRGAMITSTGTEIFIDGEQMKRKFEGVDPETWPKGEHLWALFTMFRVDPTSRESAHLDLENLLQVSGPGCYMCEQMYQPGMESTPCPGSPE